jgi:hypothetical protein
MEDLLTLAEAAEDLGIAPVTLRAAVARGALSARKFGKTWVTTRLEVQRYRLEHLGQVGRRSEPRRSADTENVRPGFTKWSDVKRAKGVPE